MHRCSTRRLDGSGRQQDQPSLPRPAWWWRAQVGVVHGDRLPPMRCVQRGLLFARWAGSTTRRDAVIHTGTSVRFTYFVLNTAHGNTCNPGKPYMWKHLQFSQLAKTKYLVGKRSSCRCNVALILQPGLDCCSRLQLQSRNLFFEGSR